jgi:hypothetical protein
MSTNPSLIQTKAKALVDFISSAITDGQKLASNLGYIPLPAEVVKYDQNFAVFVSLPFSIRLSNAELIST